MDLIKDYSDKKQKYSIIAIIILIVAFSFTSMFDTKNDHYFDKALKEAAASFTISKTLNAAVSVVQDIDISAEPFGVGISVGAGESLDPVNDIIEKFSNVMFASTLSLGVQKIFSSVGRCAFVKTSLFIVSVLLIICLLVEVMPAREAICYLFTKVFIVFTVLRFAMPVVSTINEQIYNSVIQQNMAIEVDKITILADEIANLDILGNPSNSDDVNQDNLQNNTPPQQEPATAITSKEDPNSSGLVKNVGKIWNSAVHATEGAYDNATNSVANSWTSFKQKVDPAEIKTKIDVLEKKLSEASTYLVNLAIIFVFQTIVSPLIVLFGLMKITGSVLRSKG